MASPPIDWEFRLDGPAESLYFNTSQEPDDDGVLWGINCPIPGWHDGATYRGSSSDIPFAHGADVPDQYLGPRTIHATGLIVAPDAATVERAMGRLRAATRLLAVDGKFAENPYDSIGSRYCTVRRGGAPAFPQRPGPQAATFDIQLLAGDPLKYSEAVSTVDVFSSTAVGGISFPLTFPLTFTSDADVSSSTAKSINAGDVDVGYAVAFQGPLANPIWIDRVTGNRIVLAANITPTGTPIVVDTHNETVMLGDVSVYDWLDTEQSTPFEQLVIPAHGECDWLLLGQGSGKATVTSRSAWE